ncbi:MAG TPA: hypothetical protein VJ862_11365 [Rhodanobacteraceae bacterium]|nr:hypothetical protein [Rhodanobacteraceae bacterium]
MAETGSAREFAQDNLLDRILGADKVLVALRCDDHDALLDSLGAAATRTGDALYWWRARTGLCRLPDRDAVMPGLVHLADVLRFMERSTAPGVFFLADSPAEWSPGAVVPLRRIARIDPRQPRRLVLLGTLADWPMALPARELAWGRPLGTRPRLRHGAWEL